MHVLDAEQLHRQRRLARTHREVAADRQERDVGPVQLADQPHVAEHVGVAGVIEAEAVLDLDHEAGRLAEVERRLAAARSSRRPSGRRGPSSP